MSDKKTRLAQAVAAYSLATKLHGTYKEYAERRMARRTYTASVTEEDLVFNPLLAWLEGNVNPKNIRFVTYGAEVSRRYDEADAADIYIDGYPVSVKLVRPEVKAMYVDSETNSNFMSKIQFTALDKRAIDKVEMLIASMAKEVSYRERSIHLWTIGSHGWQAKSFAKRDLDSVFLPEGVKEDLIADIEGFFASEEHYFKIGVPWHRGYVFYGPPGNGKSSTASAIARKYKMNIWSMPLSTVEDDKKLAELVSSVTKNSILLIEDIDIFSAATSRNDNHKGPTLNGLLNALDGVATPHGLMTIITTNNLDALDPALIRPGRVDKRIELREPTLYQIENMFKYVYGEPLNVEPKDFKSMAELANIFKVHVNDPEGARLDIKG